MGDCHVGIMPLPDTHFTRGKCGLKALQFMATGRPVVVSPVGMNKELIDNDRNGILATTVDEWVDALDRFGASPELRRRMGAAGRATIEERFSATSVAAHVARIIRSNLR
jgi:glycosyltransferase involved in cell wall biosynthesis